MKMTRRTVMSGAIALAGSVVMPRMSWANATLTVGTGTIDTLSDGHLVQPRSFALADTVAADAEAVLEPFGLADADMFMPDCNLTLWRDGDRVVLFDTGSGPDFMPTAGHLMAAMDTLGLTPDEVTDIVFTHGHPDHLWGVLDDFDEPLFVNAQHHMGQIEYDYWTDTGLPDTIMPERLTFAVGAARRLEVLADTISLFADGEEIIPGVTARATFGHTPGHMSFEVAAGDETIVVLGDCIANHHIAFARPDWPNGSDQDAATGIATRMALLAQLADADTVFVGFHLPTPGIGRAARNGETYQYVAMT